MAGSEFEDDSTLSITASVAGILTFLVAIVGAVWLRISSLRSADTEYERVKTALKWYKTESEWINDLVASQPHYRNDHGRTSLPTALSHPLRHSLSNFHSPSSSSDLFDEPLDRRLDSRFGTPLDPINGPLDRLRRARGRGGRFREEIDDMELETYNGRMESWRREQEELKKRERETLREEALQRQRETGMYLSVLEQLRLLEVRLLELVNSVESRAEDRVAPRNIRRRDTRFSPVGGMGYLRGEHEGWNSTGWQWMPGSWGLRTEIAVQWLPVRTKALDLMRQREALGSRVLFAQNALIGSRLGEQEERVRRQDDRVKEVLKIVKEMSERRESAETNSEPASKAACSGRLEVGVVWNEKLSRYVPSVTAEEGRGSPPAAEWE